MLSLMLLLCLKQFKASVLNHPQFHQKLCPQLWALHQCLPWHLQSFSWQHWTSHHGIGTCVHPLVFCSHLEWTSPQWHHAFLWTLYLASGTFTSSWALCKSFGWGEGHLSCPQFTFGMPCAWPIALSFFIWCSYFCSWLNCLSHCVPFGSWEGIFSNCVSRHGIPCCCVFHAYHFVFPIRTSTSYHCPDSVLCISLVQSWMPQQWCSPWQTFVAFSFVVTNQHHAKQQRVTDS